MLECSVFLIAKGEDGPVRPKRPNMPPSSVVRSLAQRVPLTSSGTKERHPYRFLDVTALLLTFIILISKELMLLKPDQEFNITLDPFNYELVVVSPVRRLGPGNHIEFAPIGLVNMLNSGGAIQSVDGRDDIVGNGVFVVEIGVKGAGDMRAYSSVRPAVCRVNGDEVEFSYEKSMVAVQVPWSGSSSKLCHVQYLY